MKILVTTLSIALFSISLANATEGLTADKVSNGTSIRFGTGTSPLEQFGKSDLGNCLKLVIEPPVNIFSLNMSITKPLGVFTCMGTRFSISPRFTTSSCQKLVSCRQNIENNGAEVSKATSILNDIIARDYVKNSMVMNGDEMERLEVLTKFAQKKYDKKLGAQCLGRFQSEGKSKCDFKIVESAFEERQKDCSFGIGCYNLEDIDLKIDSFEKFKQNNQSKYGKFTKEYFKYRTEKTTDIRIDEDNQRIKALANLAASAEFKKAKIDQRLVLIVNAIGRDNHGRLKDPILGYEFGNENPSYAKNAEKFKELIKLMDSKAASKDIVNDFSRDFEIFRRKKAETILGGPKICSKSNTLLQICNEATNISKGVRIKKDAVATEHLSSTETYKGMDFLHLKDILGPKFEEEDYDNLLNAKRCVAFGYVDDLGNPLSQQDVAADAELGLSSSLSSTTDKDEAGGKRSTNTSTASDEPRTEEEIKRNGTDVTASDTAAGLKSLASTNAPEALGEKLEVGHGPSEDVATDSFNETQAPQAQVPSAFTDMFNSGANYDFGSKPKEKAVEEVVKADDAPINTGTAASQDRMNEYLMKKLAAAEENLEKLKADAEEAEEDRAKQKKIDEEAALIKDLKGQISDLKAQSAKNNDRKIAEAAQASEHSKAATVSSNNNYGSGSSVITSRAEAAAAKAQATENYEAKRAAAPVPQTNSSKSSSSGAILSSVSNSDGSRTTTLGSGLVVTTVDGMTTEKAQQAISNRILELNGTPFYIEEGGMVKEIIAVVKDGKVLLDEKGNPIFEKIVKGKVGDKKFAAKEIKKDRAPASITDVADLKRDQEEKLKRERAEYLKLKNLTNGALKKK